MSLKISGLKILNQLRLRSIASVIEQFITFGGSFTTINPGSISSSRIARLNEDGSRVTSFITGTGFDNVVFCTDIQSDGKIVAGGFFSTYNGTTQNRITRLNTDGSRDTSFSIGTGFNNQVIGLSVQSDGKILVGGDYVLYNGATQNRIIRLNANGSKDTSFNVGGVGFDNAVYTIAIQPDGKILVGGAFSAYNGTTQNCITRLNADGSRDTSFNIGTGFNNAVQSFAIQSDGKILVGGLFTSYNGTAQSCITRLNTDGSRDTSFVIGTGCSGSVNALAIQTDGKIVAGGAFTTYNGNARSGIVRINTNGSNDSTFNIGSGFNNVVRALGIQTSGKIVAGGDFTTFGGVSRPYILRLNTDGTADTTFTISASAAVRTITI